MKLERRKTVHQKQIGKQLIFYKALLQAIKSIKIVLANPASTQLFTWPLCDILSLMQDCWSHKENYLRLSRVRGGWAAVGQSTVYINLHNLQNINLLQRSTYLALYPWLLHLQMEFVRSLLNGLRGHFIFHCASHTQHSLLLLSLLLNSCFITFKSSLHHKTA